MATYAAGTEVSSDKSIAEIRRTLQRWGAEQLMWAEAKDAAMVAFTMSGRQIRLVVLMPDRNSREFRFTKARMIERSEQQQQAAYEQAIRQRWRALNLVIKAKLEAVEAGISTFETEFLGHIVLPNGQTVYEAIGADIADAYASGEMPALLSPLMREIGGPR